MTPPDDSLPFTDDVAAATAPIYARVKNVIPAIEWPLFAPEIDRKSTRLNSSH